MPPKNPYMLTHHGAAKHQLLREYLKAWLPILSHRHKDLVVIDGFAFAGRYTDAEPGLEAGPGSPIQAIQLVKSVNPSARVHFRFMERDPVYRGQLVECVEEEGLRPQDTYRVFKEFEVGMNAVLSGIESLPQARRPPVFAFIDPYGLNVPMSVLKRLLKLPSTEAFINLMKKQFNRNMSQANMAGVFDALYGDDSWRTQLPPCPPWEASVALYLERVRASARVRFANSFDLHEMSGRLVYSMVFASNSPKGFLKMKEAMWRTDPLGRYAFRYTHPSGQVPLFVPKPNTAVLEQMALDFLAHQPELPSPQFLQWVSEHTPYLPKHGREVLRRLEDAGQLVVGGARHGKTFGKKTFVTLH